MKFRLSIFFVCVALGSMLCISSGHADDRHEIARGAANKGRFAEARAIWEGLAKEGSPDASYSLGLLYARGDGVSKNYAKARSYFETAASAGHVEAAARLGTMYLYGDGGPKDTELAERFLRQAASRGSQYAQRTLDKNPFPKRQEFVESADLNSARRVDNNAIEQDAVKQDAEPDAVEQDTAQVPSDYDHSRVAGLAPQTEPDESNVTQASEDISSSEAELSATDSPSTESDVATTRSESASQDSDPEKSTGFASVFKRAWSQRMAETQ